MTVEQIDAIQPDADIDHDLCRSLGVEPYRWCGLGRAIRPTSNIRDAMELAARCAVPTVNAIRFRAGVTLHVTFDPMSNTARSWFIDNETGGRIVLSTASTPALAISRSLLKLKYGHFQ